MSLKTGLLISGAIFAAGVGIQALNGGGATSLSGMNFLDYLSAALYLGGIFFIPIYALIRKKSGK